MTSQADTTYNAFHESSLLGGLIMTGSIRCNKCGVAMNQRSGACPKCGRAQCHINLYWKGRPYRLFQDVRGIVFSYMSALDQLLAMSRDIREHRFNPVDWQQGSIKERRLDMMLEKWLAQKKEEVGNSELSYSTYHSYRSRSVRLNIE